MDKRVVTTIVDAETVNLLERLGYEVEGYRSVIKELVNEAQDNSNLLKGEGYKFYNQEYILANAAYETAKQHFQDNYIPAAWVENKNLYGWELNYQTNILKVTLVGDVELPENWKEV